jgi:putative sigma-54 modulation protein
MRTEITFRHFDSVPALKDHASKRLAKLTRFYDGITDARVVLDVEPIEATRKSVEISLAVYRQTLTAREYAETHEEAINRCVSQLRRQILKYKDKLRSIDKDVHR